MWRLFTRHWESKPNCYSVKISLHLHQGKALDLETQNVPWISNQAVFINITSKILLASSGIGEMLSKSNALWVVLNWKKWQINFSKKVPTKRNEQIIPKWSICNFSGHMTSLHNIYISSMLKGNYVQHIHISHMVAGNGHQRCIIFTAHRLDLETEWFKS